MPALRNLLSAVLFDLDGTLIETHIDFPAMTRAMQEMASAAGVAPGTVAGRDILGMVDASAGELAARGQDGAGFRRSAFARLEAMEVTGCAHPALLPGASSLLKSLAAGGVKIGIVTRNCRTVAAGLIDRYGLPHDALLTRDDVPRTKPHPEHLWDALRVLGVGPGRAAMVGDHPMDIQAGRAAGCAVTIGVCGSHSAEYFQACAPTYVAADLSAVQRLFHE